MKSQRMSVKERFQFQYRFLRIEINRNHENKQTMLAQLSKYGGVPAKAAKVFENNFGK